MSARVVVLVALVLGLMAGCGLLPGATQDSELACMGPPEGNWRIGDREIPDVVGRLPSDAADEFARADIAVSWRYSYATDPSSRNLGYSECWCEVPPDDGTVVDVSGPDDGPDSSEWLIVMVERHEGIAGGREQPRLGWGCEPDPSSEASPGAT